ncbi:MAG: type II toxin-antitoxin system VapC family toxin [Methylococcales bacterium]|nr:type II toxin-antitoxin system VapC family toxin [Methylococcales bacterium]
MSDKMVFDTNILIYYLNGQLPESVKMHVDQIILSGDCFMSIITKIEVLGWQGYTNESLISARGLLSLIEEIELNQAVAECCIQLRNTYKIKLPDAIIAATALVQKQTLMTRNEDDFVKIVGFKVFNPFALIQ